jgi:cytidylate kinase
MSVITISRQYASGGNEIAARVCELLDYSLFDKTLMVKMATEMGLTQEQIVDFTEVDHRSQSLLDRLFGRQMTVAEVRTWQEDINGVRTLSVQKLSDQQAMAMVRSVMEAAYKRGNMVIVGRGGQAFLAGRPAALHVRIEAPLEHRVQRCMEQMDIVQFEAERLVEERDRATADYVRRYYDIDPADPLHYHLLINTGSLDLNTAAQVVALAAGQMQPVLKPTIELLVPPVPILA